MMEKETIFKFSFCTANYLLSFGLEVFGQPDDVFVIVFCFSDVFENILFLAINENMTLRDIIIPEQLWEKDYKVLVVILSVFKIVHSRESVGRIRDTRKIL